MADISKIKLANGTVVTLKDAQGRLDLTTLLGEHALAALGASAWLGVDAAVTENGTGVVTGGAIKDYVDSMIETIPEFDVVIVTELPTASADTFHKIYMMASGKISGSYVEYITIRSGAEGSYTYTWEQIGTTELDLADYVKKATKVAGIDLQDDITVSELQIALGLGDMAYADTASGSTTLETIDSITMKELTVAGNAAVTTTETAATLEKGDYTPAGNVTGTTVANGSIEVTLKDAEAATAAVLTKADYTPAGTITGEAIKGGSIEVTIKDASSTTAATIDREDYTPAGTIAAKAEDGSFSALKSATFQVADDGLQISGTVSKPSITVTPVAATVLGSVKTAGTLPTKAADTFTAGSFTKGAAVSAATEGIVASIGSGDDAETLIFTNAATDEVMDHDAEFVAPTFEEGEFTQGEMPTFENADVVGSATAALDAAPEFTGAKYSIGTTADTALKNVEFTGTTASNLKVTGVNYLKQEIDTQTFTPEAAELGFSGTKAAEALVTGVTYLKQEVDTQEFTGASSDISATFAGTEVKDMLVTGVKYEKADATAAFSEAVTPEVDTLTKTAKTIDITVEPDAK